MFKHDCTINGNLDESKFDQPIPWIGLYAATASALCALAMAADAFHGICNRKFWFPCKFFSLNATTLTLLTVATKLSVDLNTGMPRQQDQLAKLSSAVLICTVMGNFLPSLGSMDNKELLANMVALGIFVITVIVNICIQLVTGVIYMFCMEHALVMLLMLVLLAILVSSALTIPTTKRYFDRKYSMKYEVALRECNYTATTCRNKKLRDDLTRFWMMAHTCSPQFVMGRLATCTASGAVCLSSIVVLAEAMFWSYLKSSSFRFCHGESAYKWSSTLILVTQIVAIVVGSIAPAFRWFIVINLRCPKKASDAWKPDFKVEKYWTRRLSQWKEYPLALGISGRFWRKLVHKIKDKILCFCIWLQIAMVLLSKLIRLASIYFVSWLVVLVQCYKKLIRVLKCKIFTNSFHATDHQSPSMHNPDQDLKNYVLHLEGEESLIDVMVKRNFDAASQWIRMGRKQQPKHLLRHIKETEPSREFEGVWKFDSKQVPSLDNDFGEPPNGWALPVVTLTSIVIAVCNKDCHFVEELISSIKEGLNLIRIVEEKLDSEGLTSIRKAADMVWLGVDLNYKWLDVDLRKLGLHGRSSEAVLQHLAATAEVKVLEFQREETNGDLRETPSKWPIKVLAANSMYRICKTLLQNLDSSSRGDNSETVFKSLSIMVIDITAACLTNLRRVISKQCERSAIEEREESVRSAIVLLGKTEELLRILDGHPLPSWLEADQLADIDEWRRCSASIC